jgi:predicted O-methyltransferase YrrM
MSAPPEVPAIVSRAFAVSRRAGYVRFCRNETGRLLATLAATRGGTMAEFGTGCGVGTAWLRSGVRPGTQIISAELDADLATAAQEIFEDDPQVEVLAADWSTLRNKGPYSLLFLDPSVPEDAGVDAVASLVEPGGSSCSTTSPRARCGHRSPQDAWTSCARTGSPTSASPPSR